MEDGMSISFDGLEQALSELRLVPHVIAQRVLRGAVATAASVVRKEIVLRAPDSGASGPQKPGGSAPGTLKRAIYQVRNTQLCTPVQETFKVGVRQGKRATKNVNGRSVSVDAYHASWVEYGHFARVPHEMTKTAKAAGRMLGVAKWVPAHPFFRPGVAASSDAALAAMRDYIKSQLPLATAAMRFLKAA